MQLGFVISFETSDFIVDCLEQWWDDNKKQYSHIKQLVINLDNGPQNSSHRTQFMKRIIEFADKNNLEIMLAFYPPYNSKYNPIERCWGILENHWMPFTFQQVVMCTTVQTEVSFAIRVFIYFLKEPKESQIAPKSGSGSR